ncbi:hypothetical protein [Pantoea sp. AS142]|uniref:hypothetical protein n=1 Tax=Pantoea sp. AS142 TaxID=3081292 RepID=UPI00301816B8
MNDDGFFVLLSLDLHAVLTLSLKEFTSPLTTHQTVASAQNSLKNICPAADITLSPADIKE